MRVRTSVERKDAATPRAADERKGRKAPAGNACQSIVIPKVAAIAESTDAKMLTGGLKSTVVIVAAVVIVTNEISGPREWWKNLTSNSAITHKRTKSVRRGCQKRAKVQPTE